MPASARQNSCRNTVLKQYPSTPISRIDVSLPRQAWIHDCSSYHTESCMQSSLASSRRSRGGRNGRQDRSCLGDPQVSCSAGMASVAGVDERRMHRTGRGFRSVYIEATLDLLRILADYPLWREERWIPMAGDGCGNCYLLVPEPDRSCSVCFIDTISSPSELAYLVASDLWHFLTFLLQAELEATGWHSMRNSSVEPILES